MQPAWLLEGSHMDSVQVTVQLPRSLLAAAGIREQDLAALLREAIAVELYRASKLSLGKAAEVAGVATKWDMLRVLARHDVYVDYTADEAIADADTVQQFLKP